MPATRSGRALACAAFLLLYGAVRPAAGQAPEKEMFRATAEVSSILVPVTVTDSKGRLVSTLEQKRFHLYVDDIEFPIKSFWREGGLPISYSFIVDVSGSMNGRRLAMTREAIMEFMRQLRPDDEVCLITFGAGEVKRRLAFGTDPGLLPRILESLRGYGTTALYDMLTAAPQAMEGAHNIRRVLLLFTDGVDTASTVTPADAVKILESLSDPLYVFGIEPPPADEGPPDSYEELLARFGAASGARYLRVGVAAKLPQFARELRQELTMRYIITFDPSGLGTAKWRKLEVRVDGGYAVSARQGYRGTLP
ncbi:MAG TPA: VWA domain-containing protein [Thermoanaerobaculaceae bacterium]|nr:VWA domain-containing protein [Thermoanaerobaculaceae bacterium]